MGYFITVSTGRRADQATPIIAISDPAIVGDTLKLIGRMVDRAATRQGGNRAEKEANE